MYDIILTESEVNKMKIEYINCPICGKQLINLSDKIDRRCGYNEFWCDVCHIDIRIESEEE